MNFAQNSASEQTVTLHVPDSLYHQVQRTAQSQQRPIEDVLLEALTVAFPALEGLPQEIADNLAGLTFLNDAALWQIARSTLPPEHYQQMDNLLARKGQGQIGETDQHILDQLLQEYETLVLRRGQAAVLLQRRGYDLSDPALLNNLP